MTERVCNWEYMKREGFVMDYCSDLNACHEMEKTLHDSHANDEWSIYCTHLNRIACRLACGGTHTCGYTVSATAKQRAIAFCRTVGIETE